ncbi:hypothetical protein B9Z19DRAFT_540530 [Tuber borchii]|uniref:Uncharacterized protein n=1 Tax=Tuber borchii TaxID=42251 RepID=A0A2T6ZD66_TUBBO|nr:hypothetical protein B9Z19DRAFT_540530 [Tuber borchii]
MQSGWPPRGSLTREPSKSHRRCSPDSSLAAQTPDPKTPPKVKYSDQFLAYDTTREPSTLPTKIQDPGTPRIPPATLMILTAPLNVQPPSTLTPRNPCNQAASSPNHHPKSLNRGGEITLTVSRCPYRWRDSPQRSIVVLVLCTSSQLVPPLVTDQAPRDA